MNTMKILVTGGKGRLATELKKNLIAHYVDIEDFDLTQKIPKGEYDLILHMAAFTDVAKAEKEYDKCFMDNTYGTFNLANVYKNTPFVYISTEYANNPISIYALTKYLGEEIVRYHPCYLILRTSFKPNPWPFDFAYENQFTQGDYIDLIAKLLKNRIETWDKKTCLFEYLGTGRKKIIDLARKTKPDVLPNRVEDYTKKVGNIIPHDYA